MANDMGPDTVQCTVKAIEGDVIMHPASGHVGFLWKPASVDMAIRSMDQIVTSRGAKATFETPDGRKIELKECEYFRAGVHVAGWRELPDNFQIDANAMTRAAEQRIYVFIGDAIIELTNVRGWLGIDIEDDKKKPQKKPRSRKSRPPRSAWNSFKGQWYSDSLLDENKYNPPTIV